MPPSESFSDRDSWEQRWKQALREHGDAVAQRPPSPYLSELADLLPGRALDAGCGHGAESVRLADEGWRVTAVDFSSAALDRARTTAAATGVTDRIDWVEGDLGVWTPEPAAYDLVLCLYVHVAGSVVEAVQRLAGGVAPGGTLFLAGHQPVDPATGEPTPAAGQNQANLGDALSSLDPDVWEIAIAEERRRPSGGGVDAVVRASRVG